MTELEDLDALLPTSLPVLPGVAVSGAYVLGGSVRTPRGDGLAVFPLPDGRTGLLVCDAPGSGSTAVLVASRMLGVVRAAVGTGACLTEAVASVEAYARTDAAARGTGLTLVAVDPGTGDLEAVCAGQDPPLLCPSGGTPRALPVPTSRPLGLGGSAGVASAHLPLGAVLLLHTGGLLERWGTSAPAVDDLADALVTGAATMSDEVWALPGEIDVLVKELLTTMQDSAGFRDDVALLAAVRRPPPEAWSRSFTAHAAPLALAVDDLDAWLGSLGASLLDRLALRHAVVEVGTNAVRHAYASAPPGPVEVRAALDGRGEVTVSVSDHGRWLPSEAPGEGDGLVLAGGLVDHLTLDRQPDGTTVTLRQGLGRPVPLYGALLPGDVTLDAVRKEPMTWRLAASSTLTVSGAVDDDTADQFASALHTATRAGTADCLVDLSSVTQLCGEGVVHLYRAQHRAEANDSRFSLRCPTGTPVAGVLRRVGLDALVVQGGL